MEWNHMVTGYDIIGVLGTSCVLGAYFGLAAGLVDNKGIVHPVLNAIGAILIMISLTANFNLASFVMQIAWLLISLAGIVKFVIYRVGE